MAKEIVRIGGNGRRSKCVAYDGLVYVSGTTTIDIHADVQEQTRDVLEQIDKMLAVNGTDKRRVLSATIFLSDMEKDYGGFNAVWDEWVIDGYEPTRSVSEVKLALPEYKVEIALVAAQ